MPLRAQEQIHPERINVVASFSILADLVRNVGGDRVSLTTLVGNQGDVHVYVPSAGDAMRIAHARLVVVNGLGLEGWLERLVQSSGSRAQIVTVSAGVTALREDARPDPHAWQSVPNARIYVINIARALEAASPGDAGYFRARAGAYLEKLAELDRDARAEVARIPRERRVVISTHDAFGYFTAEYGIRFIAPLGVSTENEPAARDIATIISQIRAEKIPAVFLENVSDERLIRRIATETGARVGGTLISDSLTDENGPAPTYIDMVRHNIRVLSTALGP
ncbi:MAG: zinc ABC transporter substrate-binding protein [Alphaproteobacteria bacterium]|nr:zinc ABC transporter substrate-binding protein [Alphaproteobacteria bacterium]